MKAIMISIKPKWCALEMNGDKTIEIRSSKALATAIQKLIDKYGFADIYVYCCKDNKQRLYPVALLDKSNQVFKRAYREDKIDNRTNYLNGKVAFKFRCYKVEEMILPYTKFRTGEYVHFEEERKWQTPTMNEDEILKLSCLTEAELYEYLVGKNNGAYAIHISDLEIFNKPRELSEFIKYDNHHIRIENCFIGFGGIPRLTKAPQNFYYVEE